MSALLSLLASGALAAAPATVPTTSATAAALQRSPTAPPEAQRPILTLEEAMAQAQTESLDLEVLRARAEQAETISAKVWSGYLPQLTVGASYTYNNVAAAFAQPTAQAIREFPPGTNPAQGPDDLPGAPTNLAVIPYGFVELEIQKKHALAGQAQLNQALIAPALWPAIQVAGLSERVSQLNIENARREVLFAVAQSFYAVATMQESVKVTEALLEVSREHERDAQLKVDAGMAPKLTLLRAQLDRSRAEQDVVRSQTSLVSTRLALAALINRRPDFDVSPPPEPQVPGELERGEVVELANQAVSRRPDVEAARTQTELAEAQNRQNWFRYFPSIGFTARYNLSNAAGFTGEFSTWALGLGLNWTIFDGGLREADIRESRARVREARALSAQADRRTRDEVFRARLDLESARANRLKAEDSARLARESAQLAELQFKAGAATYIEASDANTVLTQAEVGLLTERLNEQLAALQLLRAAGLFAAE